jgi:hypothetical protein
VNQLKIFVSKKQLVELTITEGWYSEDEMKTDLKWASPASEFADHVIYIYDV